MSALAITLVVPAGADVFSVDPASEAWANPGDLLVAGPEVHVTRANLGLTAGDNVDALSLGYDVVSRNDIIYFSVDRDAVGLPGTAVAAQAANQDAAADIFVTVTLPVDGEGVYSSPRGDNALHVNQHRFGLNGVAGDADNLDAYSMEEFDFNSDRIPDLATFFSLDAASPSLDGGFSPADILVKQPGPNGALEVFRDATTMGLTEGDDIDALALFMGLPGIPAQAYFSLAPGSPSGLPGDVFYTQFDGHSIQYSAASLGLLDTDNVDSLETTNLPEPMTLTLLGLIASLAGRRR